MPQPCPQGEGSIGTNPAQSPGGDTLPPACRASSSSSSSVKAKDLPLQPGESLWQAHGGSDRAPESKHLFSFPASLSAWASVWLWPVDGTLTKGDWHTRTLLAHTSPIAPGLGEWPLNSTSHAWLKPVLMGPPQVTLPPGFPKSDSVPAAPCSGGLP